MIYVFLTVIEVLVLKLSGRVESPKYIWFPVLANVGSFIIVFVVGLLVLVFGAVGFVIAFGDGYEAGEVYLYLAMVSLGLIPVLIFIVRSILFLAIKLGKFSIAFGYSLLTSILSLAALLAISWAFFTVWENMSR